MNPASEDRYLFPDISQIEACLEELKESGRKPERIQILGKTKINDSQFKVYIKDNGLFLDSQSNISYHIGPISPKPDLNKGWRNFCRKVGVY